MNLSAGDNSAIKFASEFNHPEVVKILLADNSVDPSANNNYAIISASSKGHLEVVKLLLADGRISIKIKIQSILVLETTKSFRLLPVFDIKRIEYLASRSLQDIIKHGDDGEYDRELHFV